MRNLLITPFSVKSNVLLVNLWQRLCHTCSVVFSYF